jgi:hypothetical protein
MADGGVPGVLGWLDGETPVEGHLATPGLLALDLVDQHDFTLRAIQQVHG